MKQVRFYALQDGPPDTKFVGRIVYNKGEIKFEGLPSNFVDMVKSGIVIRRHLPRVYPLDGLKFLEAVSHEYGKGSYFWAGDVEDVSEEDDAESSSQR